MSNRVRFNSWLGFRRQLRRKCGPLVDVVKSEITVRQSPLENDSDADDDIGPDDVVQFMHRTVKDFLQSPNRQGPLHFSEKAAIEMVVGVAKRYIEIGFPKSKTNYYVPASAKADGDWHEAVRKYSDHLENRILLRFTLSILSPELNQLGGDLNIWAWTDSLLCVCPNSQDINEVRGLVQKELMFYPACHTKSSGYDEALEQTRSIVLGEFIHYACAKGLTIATENFLKLCLETTSLDRGYLYAIANGALLTAVERDLVQEVCILTRRQRHQSRLVSVNADSWPVGRKKKYKRLDPFIGLAVRSGSVKIIDYLFKLTDGYYARDRAVWEFAITSMNLRQEVEDDEEEDMHIPDPSAQINWLQSLVFSQAESDSTYPRSVLESPEDQRQPDKTGDVLDPGNTQLKLRLRHAESDESFESVGIARRVFVSERRQEKREFLQLHAGCIFLANKIHTDQTSASGDQSGSANEGFLEDVKEALRIVMERLVNISKNSLVQNFAYH
jgi:hypothetical protein